LWHIKTFLSERIHPWVLQNETIEIGTDFVGSEFATHLELWNDRYRNRQFLWTIWVQI